MTKPMARSVFDALRAITIAIAATGIAGLTGYTWAQAPNIVQNGGFETPAVVNASTFDTKPAGSTKLTPWVIGGQAIDHIKGYWQPAAGTQSIDLDGNTNAGSIAQVLTTEVGRSYLLKFKYSGNPDRGTKIPKMTVRWAANPNGTPTLQKQYSFSTANSKSNMKWVQAQETVVATTTSTKLSFTSDDNSPYGIALDDISVTLLPLPLATPALVRVYSTGSNGAYVIGRVDGAVNAALTLQAYAGQSCTGGVLGSASPAGPTLSVTTDPNGYFGASIASGVTPGYFVAIQVTAPAQTAMSSCLVSSADNDTWPRALKLSGATLTAALTARDYIDSPGKVRWFKFDVLPGQRVTVSLSGLPADYDLAVFKDINATFLKVLGVTTSVELTRLSAEYAPSVWAPGAFAPGAFAPGAFAPGAFAADAFAPGAFAPGAFAPGAFAPGAFAPGAFAPGAFAPGAFAPGAFAPGAFAPGAFAPGAFAPAGFDPGELAMAFSSAQTRSIIGVSATPGVGDEVVVANSWNNIGSFYVRVVGRGGAYSTGNQFQVDIARGASSCAAVTDTTLTPRSAAPGANLATVILTDSSKVALDTDLGGGTTLRGTLEAFAARPEVTGVIVDVAGPGRVSQLKSQAATNFDCPYAMNLVAEEIKGIVDSYRTNNPGLRYVVIAGNDDAIPFFRYQDQSLLGDESGFVPPVKSDSVSEASLRRNYVLSQDAYGSGTRVSLRTSEFPVPGLAVGRLVETPSEIAGMIDAYVATGGVVAPKSSFVSGYDFLEDAAKAVKDELACGTGFSTSAACSSFVSVSGAAQDTLITSNSVSPADPKTYQNGGPWTATDLGAKLFGSTHDVIYLAGHFSANSALAADFSTNLLTTDLSTSTTNFTNSIVFSAGCHSGYNIVDAAGIPGVTVTLDWVQAFAQKKATLIAGTGYQYGDTDFIEYSERLYKNFARQLRAGTGAVAIGEALVKSKLDYLAATPDIRGIHEKALLEATLFGLPMLGVNMPSGRGATGVLGTPVTPTLVTSLPGAHPALLLKTANITIADALTPNSTVLTNVEAGGPSSFAVSWLSGTAGVVSNPIEPVLPLVVRNASSTDGTVLRGVGFRGGSYTDSEVIPLSGAATTEIRGVHVPFASSLFYPMRPWSVSYFGALAGNGGTSLLVTPVQHRASDLANYQSTRRQFSSYSLRLYYSGYTGAPAMSDALSVVSVVALPISGGVEFTAQIVGDPNVGVQEAWITYTSNGSSPGSGTWAPLDLVQCVVPLPAVCGGTQDSRIWKGQLASQLPNLRYVIQAANGAGLVTFDDNRGLYYSLAGANQSPATLSFVGTVPTSANFGDTITVDAKLESGGTPIAGKQVLVSVGGSARAKATDSAGNVSVSVPVVSVPGSYKVTASFAGDDVVLPSAASADIQVSQAPTTLAAEGIGAKLAATIGGSSRPLLQETVKFSVTGAASKDVYLITDYVGQATLPPTGLPAGSYSLSVSFAGNATYAPVSMALPSLLIQAQTIDFGGAGLPSTLAFGSAPVEFTVSSGSGLPISVGLTPGSSVYCLLSGTAPTYTLAAVSPGTCTLVASVGGTTTFTDVTVTQDITISKGDQAIAFDELPSKTYGDAAFAVSATGGATSNPVTFSSTTPLVCTVIGNTVTIVAAGTCTIAADQAGDTFWNSAPTVARSFTVDRKAQQITFAQPATSAVYNSSFTIGATSDSGLAVTLAASGVCTLNGSSVTMTSGTGTCTLTASQAGDLNYQPAAAVVHTVTATPATQSITFAQPPTPAAYNSTFAVSASSSSGLAVAIAPSGACSISSGTVTMTSGTGACTLTASQSGDANYSAAANVVHTVNAALAAQSLTAPMTITPPAPTFVLNGTFTVSTSATSGLAVAYTSLTVGQCTVPAGSNVVTMLGAGLCTIAADQGGNDNYQAAQRLTQSVTIGRASQTITFANPGSKTLATPTFALVATASSGLPVAFAASGSCTVSGTTLTLTATGSCTVTPSQSGDSNYDPVTGAAQTFQIDLANLWKLLTAKMTKARLFHTATRLESGPLAGRVLIAGGIDRTGTRMQSSELYNPTTRTFVAVGNNMPAKVSDHTATLLQSGKVIVLGGGSSSAQMFDPATGATGTWSSAGSPSSSLVPNRSNHTATRLPNGKVLFVGGKDSSGNTLKSTIVYDPAGSGTFAAGPVLDIARELHTATLLPDGTVLIVGGRAKSGSSYTTHATYQLCNGAVTPIICTASTGSIGNRHSHAAVALGPDGSKVLVAGGANGSTDLATAALFTYNLTTFSGTWSTSGLGSLAMARSELTLSELPNGRALAAGGIKGTAKNAADAYTPPFAPVAPMNIARAGHTATVLKDAAGNITGILVAGGGEDDADDDDALDRAEIYGTQ